MSLEFNFDGIVGPTHNYGGLSLGNTASARNEGEVSNPRAAALQGLAKMRFVRSLGLPQAVLPPHPRPSLSTLRALGFTGSDHEVIARASKHSEHTLRLCSSAAAMWAANAATVAPSQDTLDGRVHITVANLQSMFHRAMEAETTESVLRAIFADPLRFSVHAALPGGGHFADEGAANHLRLCTKERPAAHLFAFGRSAYGNARSPSSFPARQTLEASEAVARLNQLSPDRVLFAQQHPDGIDAGAFHTDVMAVGTGAFLMIHERAFVDTRGVIDTLQRVLGDGFKACVAREEDLSSSDAVRAYPFNSQVLSLPGRDELVVLAPEDSRENPGAKAFFDRVLADDNPVTTVHYINLRQSMQNGGGPACLRLRVLLNEPETAALGARVLLDDSLDADISGWISGRYRDQLRRSDLADPALAQEAMGALDELTQILRLGSVYDFQRV